jgi:prevent-host-death family protein
MITVPATEMRRNLGTCVENALREPVMVERTGRPSIVMLSASEYERLKVIEEVFWGDMANKAVAEGFLNPVESQQWFKGMQGNLNAAA